MRQFVICMLVALLSGGAFSRYVHSEFSDPDHIQPLIFEDLINSTIYGIINNLSNPIVVDDIEFDFSDAEDSILTGSARITDFNTLGVKDLMVPYLNLAAVGLHLNFTFVFPEINLSTNYWADLSLLNFIPLYGEGNATIDIQGLQIEGTATANSTGDEILVTGVRVQIDITNATFDIHGLLNDEDFSLIVSSILNDIAVNFIDEHHELVTEIVSPILQSIIDGLLGGGDDTGGEGRRDTTN